MCNPPVKVSLGTKKITGYMSHIGNATHMVYVKADKKRRDDPFPLPI